MSNKKYHVGCGFFAIYAGILNSKGDMWKDKSNVTDEVLSSSAQYLMGKDISYMFETPDGEKYIMSVEKVVDNE